jgi:hypothetical protein
MPANPGTWVIEAISTPDTLDQFATHHSNQGEGGLHSVATIVDRDAISAERRLAGMMCYVVATLKYYTLGNDLLTWTEFGSSNLVITRIDITGPTPALTPITVNASGATWVQSLAAGYLGTAQAVFDTTAGIEVLLNGTYQTKHDDAVYVTDVSFTLSTALDIGDVLTIISLAP